MERKTIDTLRTMVCGELEDIAKKGSLSHESLDVMKDLLQSEHYLDKIEEKAKELEEMGYMDRGYSQRKYYIDADYDPYKGHSYNRGRDMDRYSYGYSMNRPYDDGNSYMYYDPRYDQPMYPMMRGYAKTGSKSEMVEELHKMMNETTDETVKKAIQDAVSKIK